MVTSVTFPVLYECSKIVRILPYTKHICDTDIFIVRLSFTSLVCLYSKENKKWKLLGLNQAKLRLVNIGPCGIAH